MIMIYFNCYFINFFFINVFAQTSIINIYFDSATKLLTSGNGVVIVELSNKVKSTICSNSINSTNDAIVACRSMNYNTVSTTTLSAVAFISSIKTTFAQAYLQNLSCIGTETSLENCPGFEYTSKIPFGCLSNSLDLNVLCFNTYTINTTSVSSDCSKSLSVTIDAQQLLTWNCNGENVFFCGSRNQFGLNEAQLFCNLVYQKNSTTARIVRGVNMTGLSVNLAIGGFNNMTCPSNATSLTDCSNPFPYQSDGCMPSDNIAVFCDVTPLTTDDYPSTVCGRNFLTLTWNLSSTSIKPGDVYIIYQNGPCTSISTTNDTNVLNVTVSFNNCNNGAYGDSNNIIYSYLVNRTFPTVANVTVKNNQLFNASCYIPRNDTVIQGPISINPASISGGNSASNIKTKLTLYTDSTFNNEVSQLINVPIGIIIFVKVEMISPPLQIVLVLVNCSVEAGTTVPLITNRCPVASQSVQINPISLSIVSFNFKSFNIPGATTMNVFCYTSKCGLNEIGCLTSC